MKVLYVAPRYHTNQVPIIEGWVKAGDEVAFVSQYVGGTEDYTVLEPIVLGNPLWFKVILGVYKKLKKAMGKVGKDFVIQAKYGPAPLLAFSRLIKSKKPDVVIMRDRSVYNIGVSFVCKLQQVPAILYTQLPLWEDINCKGGIVRWAFRKCTPKVRITPVLGEEIQGITTRKPGANYVPFVMEPHISPENKTYFIEEQLNILGVGKYVGQKRHELILRLAKDLKEKHPELKFHITIIGEEVTDEQKHYFTRMVKYQKEHHLEDVLSLERNFKINQVYEVYAKTDLFVLPSKGEVASISHLEAMSCSLPVICSKSNGTSCYIEQGQNGYIFDDEKYEDFYRYVELLAMNRVKIVEMGRRSYELVMNKHSFKQYKKSISKIIESVDK